MVENAEDLLLSSEVLALMLLSDLLSCESARAWGLEQFGLWLALGEGQKRANARRNQSWILQLFEQ